MSDNETANDFRTRALEMAQTLTRGNTYKLEGQAFAEARAADIRRVFNILTTGEAAQIRPRAVPVVGPGSVVDEDGNFTP